jgi:hypothetical protein
MNHGRHESQHSGAFGGAFGVFVVTLLVAKLAWGWLVPVIFAGAVSQGTVSASLSWASAAIIAALVAALVFFIRHPRRHEHCERPALRGTTGA